jgi:hypothetical protein
LGGGGYQQLTVYKKNFRGWEQGQRKMPLLSF